MEISPQPARTMIGVSIRTSNAKPHEIGALWQRFIMNDLAAGISGRTTPSMIAVYCDYEGDHTKPFTFILGCEVEAGTAPPEGYVARTIPAGAYGHFAATGMMPQALAETWQGIWSAPIKRTFQADFEIHTPGQIDRVDIFVGLESHAVGE